MAGTASPRDRLKVTVTRRLPQAVESRIAELFDVSLRDVDVRMTREELAAALTEAFGQAAAQAPQPMQVAASNARSAATFGTGVEFASTAAPVLTEMYPPDSMMRS